MTEEKLEKALRISLHMRDLSEAIENMRDYDFIRLPVTQRSYHFDINIYLSKERIKELNEMLRQEAETNLREELEKLKAEFEKL